MIQNAAKVVERRTAPLRTEIQLLRAGAGNADAFVRALRESVLHVLPLGGTDLCCLDGEGIRWLLAFTGPAEVAEYAVMSGRPLDVPVPTLTVSGERLLDVALPALRTTAGLALDVAGPHPMLVPDLPSGPEEVAR